VAVAMAEVEAETDGDGDGDGDDEEHSVLSFQHCIGNRVSTRLGVTSVRFYCNGHIRAHVW